MEARSALDGDTLEQFRPYLRHLAQAGVNQHLRRKVDASDIVQDTLLLAYRSRAQLRGDSEGAVAAWLREILANRITRAYRDFHRGKRDIRLERFLHQSSTNLESLIPAQRSSPSRAAQHEELAIRVAGLLDQLSERERIALVEHKLEGRTLADVAAHLDCSQPTVVRLIRRALEQLRGSLSEL